MRVEVLGVGPAQLLTPRLPPSGSTHSQPFRVMLRPSAPLTPAAARAHLSSAWAAVTGSPASASTSSVLTAHWALETDAGRAMPGRNFAGIKAAAAAPGPALSTREGFGPTEHEVNAKFRHYDSFEAGAHDYISLLAARYPDALAAAARGDIAGFGHALAQGGYFTADPRVYVAGLEQRFRALEGGTPTHALAMTHSSTALASALAALSPRPCEEP